MGAERVLSVVLAVAIGVAAVLACSSEVTPGGPPGRGVYIPEDWQTIRTVDGHHLHLVQKRIPCAKCHALTATAIGAVLPERCAACHEEQADIEHASEQARVRFGPEATADCTSCHAFTAELPADPQATGPVQPHAPSDCARCHLSPQNDTPATLAHQTQECVACHRPHHDADPQSAPCDECHAEITTRHAVGKNVLETCKTCHEHQHAPARAARSTCGPCHQETEPTIAGSALFADGHAECIGCHRPHAFDRSSAVRCQSCHEHRNVLGGPRIPAHNQCTSCHDPHDVKGASADGCSKCHSEVNPNHPKHGVAGTCTGCHDPHPPSSRALTRARDCSTCHQGAAHDDAYHRGVACRQCHQPHDFLLASRGPGQLCGDCHGERTTLAAGNPGHQQCAGCHRGLPHRPQALLTECRSCHDTQHAQATGGHAACLNCHEPHGGALEKACKDCHSGQHQTAPRGHKQCTQCHQPHSGSAAVAGCPSCHAAEAKTAHGAISATCDSCHRPHGPSGVSKPPPCTQCHERPGLAGLHQIGQHVDCGRCHSAHAPDVGPQRASCLGCHTDRSDHFPQAPSCASCHLFGAVR